MPTTRFASHSLALLASGATLLVSELAVAATCTTDDQCPKNYACQAQPVACPEIACAPDQNCPPIDCKPVSTCVPKPCTADTDCGDGMVCHTENSQECSGATTPACPPGADCLIPVTDPPAPTCTTTTHSECVPQYFLPCTTAASCGDGFDCVPETVGECSGSAGTGETPPSAGETPPGTGGAPSGGGSESAGAAGALPVDPSVNPGGPISCTSTPTGTNRCEPKRLPCATSAQCPSNWSCAPDPDVAVSGGCAAPPGGDCAPSPAPPVETICIPPYSDLGAGFGFGETTGIAKGEAGGLQGNEGVGGATGSEPAGDTTAPTAPAHSKAESGSEGASSDSGGCQMGHGRKTGTGAALLGVLGLLGLVRRRREQAPAMNRTAR